MIQRLSLSGLFCSGKDHTAELAGYQIESFAAALYKICEYYFGTADKTIPSIRRFMQQVGQWGWGYYHPTAAPYTVERAAITECLRRWGSQITVMPEYRWNQFGLEKTFWVDGLIYRVLNEWPQDSRIAVTNVRFQHEIEPMAAVGFEHYLVHASLQSRAQRNGGFLPANLLLDISEQFALELLETLPDSRIIWDDNEPMPAGHDYLTVKDFVSLAN